MENQSLSTNQTTDLIDLKKVKRAGEIVRAITNTTRMQILHEIKSKKTIAVGDLYNKIKLEQSAISSHLKILRDANLVNVKADGKKRIYTLNEDKFYSIDKGLETILSQILSVTVSNQKRSLTINVDRNPPTLDKMEEMLLKYGAKVEQEKVWILKD